MTSSQISELEHSAWSMFSFMGRGPGGRVVDTPTRLVIETPVDRPPYNAVLRFHDEGDRPLRDQAEALLTPMMERGVTPSGWCIRRPRPPFAYLDLGPWPPWHRGRRLVDRGPMRRSLAISDARR